MLYGLHVLSNTLCGFTSSFFILWWISFFFKNSIFTPFLSVEREASYKQSWRRHLWELCRSFGVTLRASLGHFQSSCPDFMFLVCLLSLSGRRHQKVTTKLKLQSDPLTFLQEPLILFCGIGHILFIHCKTFSIYSLNSYLVF